MYAMTNWFGIFLESQVSTEDNMCLPYSGSYDHTVKPWDSRCNSSVLTVDHGSSVERLQLFPKSKFCCNLKVFSLHGFLLTIQYACQVLYFTCVDSWQLTDQWQGNPRLFCASCVWVLGPIGSNIIKVWDIPGGGRLLAGFWNHQKTITSL